MSRSLDPRLLPAAPSLRPMLLRLTALQLVGAAATLAQAALLAEVVARVVLGGQHGQQLAHPLVLLAAVAVARAALAAGQEWLVARASARVRSELRLSVLSAVTRLGPVWADRQPTGRLAAATGPGIESLDGYVTRALPAMTAACVVPGLVWLRIVLADWRSGVVLVLTLPLVPVFMVLVGVTTRRRMEARYAALAGLAGHFLDLVEGLTTLKIYGQAKRQVATVRRATEAYRLQTMETLRVVFLSGLVLDLIATLSVAVVAVSVGLRLDQGHLDLRNALVVLLLAPELFAPLRVVGAQHHAAEEGRAAVIAALDLIAEAGEVRQHAAAGEVRTDGAVVVRALTVGFDGRPQAALDRVDLSIEPGTLVVLQGRSGAGKSTLLAVLLGFVDPTAGMVGMAGMGDAGEGDEGRTVRDPASWRAGLAWVPQRPKPTQRDVWREVGLGDPAATQAEVLSAVAACHAPHPLTLLGEDGGLISAGQRRRVALARALLRARAVQAAGGVPILLLDEPSEDLDLATEDVVASVISGLAGWATVLMVTHSDRLAKIADRRLELADGRIVADEHRVRVPTMPAPPAFPAAPAAVGPAAAPGSASWRLMLAAAAGLRRRLLLAVALAGATGLAGVALTATSVWLICRAAQHPNLQALAVAVVGVRTFALARALLRYGERLAGHDVALRLLAEVRAGVFAALEPLAPAGLAEFRRGDLLRRFVSDVDGVQEGLVRAVIPLAGAVVTGSGAVAVAALVSPMAALALGAGLLAGLVVAPLAARTVAGSATALSAAAGLRDERSTALLGGLAELTAYGHVGVALDEVAAADAAVVRGAIRPAVAAAVGAAISGLATGLTLVLVLAAGARAVAGGGSSAVGIGVLVAAVLAGTDGLAALPVSFAAWSRFRTGIDRVAVLLAAASPVPEPACAAAVPAGALSLGAVGLALSPGGAAPTIIAAATFAVQPGQRVVLSGPSGCGKSTLLKAALRLLPAYGGSLELAGDAEAVALADLGCDDVPPLVAGSLQGDHVFNASLLDNLLVARPQAGEAAVVEAVALAGLDDFVGGLPDGLATSAGPDGAALSGGQRQRLLLARALLAAPQVLVLDEPTAHLDETTERAVLAQLLVGTSGRTVLMTSHRLLPREDAAVCLQLLDGVLVAEAALLVG